MDSYKTYSDEQLISLLKDNDEMAFREIYLRYWKKLLYKTSQRIEEVTLAEEAIQDVFISLWNKRQDLTFIFKLDIYLATACVYQVMKYRRKRRRELEARQKATQQNSFSENVIENELALEDLEKQIAGLVAALPEQTRLVYRLSREEGHSHKIIAAKLDISPKTVDYHISKAIKQLRSALSGFLISIYFFFF